jgi:hypothetical protein
MILGLYRKQKGEEARFSDCTIIALIIKNFYVLSFDSCSL